MNQVLICVIEEIIEEMQKQVENHNNCTFGNICTCFAENHAGTDNALKLVVREPYHQYTDNRCGQRHGDNIRTVFSGLVARVVDDVRADTRQRNVGKHCDNIHNVHVRCVHTQSA